MMAEPSLVGEGGGGGPGVGSTSKGRGMTSEERWGTQSYMYVHVINTVNRYKYVSLFTQ